MDEKNETLPPAETPDADAPCTGTALCPCRFHRAVRAMRAAFEAVDNLPDGQEPGARLDISLVFVGRDAVRELQMAMVFLQEYLGMDAKTAVSTIFSDGISYTLGRVGEMLAARGEGIPRPAQGPPGKVLN